METNKLRPKPLTLLIGVVLWPGLANAMDQGAQQRGLDMIEEFANETCPQPPLAGESDHQEISGDIGAGLSGLMKKLADAGVQLEGVETHDSYKGILQSQLAGALHDATTCRQTIVNELAPLLIAPVDDGPVLTASEKQELLGIPVDQEVYLEKTNDEYAFSLAKSVRSFLAANGYSVYARDAELSAPFPTGIKIMSSNGWWRVLIIGY